MKRVARKYVPVKCAQCGCPMMRYVKCLGKRSFCCHEHKGLWQSENQKGNNNPNFGPNPNLQGEKNPNFGKKWNDANRQRQSLATKERMKDPLARFLSGSANRGKKFSKERCENIRVAHVGMKGTPHTPDARRLIGVLSKQKWTDEFKNRFRKTMEVGGRWISLDKKDDWEIYFKQADWAERMYDRCTQSENELLKQCGVFNAHTNTKGVVRDHIYSRRSGFENGVFPEILRHPSNCRIITHRQNLQKKFARYIDGDDIPLLVLFDTIRVYSGSWFEQEKCLELIVRYESGERWKRNE